MKHVIWRFHVFIPSLVMSPFLDDYVFIVGASCWETGQLEREITQGYWLLCEGPLLFDHLLRAIRKEGEEAEIWEEFTSSVSKLDAELASVLSETVDDDDDENGLACDV